MFCVNSLRLEAEQSYMFPNDLIIPPASPDNVPSPSASVPCPDESIGFIDAVERK